MPRLAREYSNSDIYHIYVRGNNRNIIFKDKIDKAMYLSALKKSKKKFGVEIYAYAIMDNHIHILLRVDSVNLSKAMKYVQQSYTLYFNKKYNHMGRVFASRFNSKPCNDDIYLTELVKYIHLNPIRAGLGYDYMNEFTSHKCYSSGNFSFCDVSYILSIFSDDMDKARNLYLRYLDS